MVNFGLPQCTENYVHRIGRTGRAGHEGEALSLVSVDEEGFLEDIERLLKRPIEQLVVEGFEPDPRIQPPPSAKKAGGRNRSAPGTRFQFRKRRRGGGA